MTDDLLGYSVHFVFGGDEYFFSHTVFGEHETARNIICLFFAGNEGISIIENADRLGIPIPGFIRDRFLNMKKLNKKKVSA